MVRAQQLDVPGTAVTGWLQRWSDGDEKAVETVFPRLYDELHRLAGRICAGERPDHTLGATGLLHEVYLEIGDLAPGRFRSRADFMALAATLMRRALVDHSRRRLAAKRGGDLTVVPLIEALDQPTPRPEAFIALDDALAALSEVDARKAKIIELRFFAGFGVDEVAEQLGLSPRTVAREWQTARAMLARLLSDDAR